MFACLKFCSDRCLKHLIDHSHHGPQLIERLHAALGGGKIVDFPDPNFIYYAFDCAGTYTGRQRARYAVPPRPIRGPSSRERLRAPPII